MSQFKKAFKGIDLAIKQGTARALNRALSSTKTQLVRDVRKETGLSKDDVAKRTLIQRANTSNQAVRLVILTKVGIPLRLLNPKVQNVRKNRTQFSRPRVYKGVSVKIGNKPRTTVPGGFLITKYGNPIVVGRKGQARRPTVQLRTDILSSIASTKDVFYTKYMRDRFDSTVEAEIEFYVKKKFSTNK